MKSNHSSLKAMMIGAEDEENLAIRYLGAVLKNAGHEVAINPCSKYEDFPKTLWYVNRFCPQLIGISIAFQSLALMYCDLVKKIKENLPNVYIMVGGHFPTFEYKKILETQKSIDSVGRFEGEKTVVELAEFLLKRRGINQVTNLVYRNGTKIYENECLNDFPSLDDLPWPIRDKNPQVRLNEKFATLVSSRGCWHSSCLYCCIGAFHSKKPIKFKLRGPKLVAEEISNLFYKKGVRLFQFHDDNFMMPSKFATTERLKELHKWLVKYNVPLQDIAFLIKARPDTVDDEVVDWLKKIGTIGVFLGIENASETGLLALRRRTNTTDNQKALLALHNKGIAATYNLLIFHPKATPEEIRQNVDFMNSFYFFPFDFGRAEVCAGTPLECMLRKENKLKGEWPNWDYEIEDKRVNRMFQIYRKTFRDKRTGYSYLIHLNIALGYNAKLIERLHPGIVQRDLTKEAESLIIEINRFIGDRVLILSSSLDRAWREEEVTQFREKLEKGCKERIKSIEDLNQKMTSLVAAEHIFSKFKIEKNTQKVLNYLPKFISKI